jgi:hypothetical protein
VLRSLKRGGRGGATATMATSSGADVDLD